MTPVRVIAAVLLVLTAVPAAHAQDIPVHRVLTISIGADPANPVFWRPFFERMQQLSYVGGKAIVYDHWFGSGRSEGLAEGVADLVRRRPEVIVTTGVRETEAAARATSTIPIVMTLVPIPITGRGVWLWCNGRNEEPYIGAERLLILPRWVLHFGYLSASGPWPGG
jgi:ABC-type uncharacterized transport system substrate-binding protein